MTIISNILASFVPPVEVPDTGATALMLGAGIISLGVLARFLKNRKK